MSGGGPETTIQVLPIILLLLGAGAIYVVIRRRLYVQGLLCLLFLGAVTSAVWGIAWLQDSGEANDWQGVALLATGFAGILLSAICVWKFYFRRQKTAS